MSSPSKGRHAVLIVRVPDGARLPSGPFAVPDRFEVVEKYAGKLPFYAAWGAVLAYNKRQINGRMPGGLWAIVSIGRPGVASRLNAIANADLAVANSAGGEA